MTKIMFFSTSYQRQLKSTMLAHQQYLNAMGHRTTSNKGNNQLDSSSNPVSQPKHYTSGKIECWDYLEDNMPPEAFIGGLEWNIKKYLHRWRYKEKPIQDLRKAQEYLTKLIEHLERNNNVPTGSSSPDS